MTFVSTRTIAESQSVATPRDCCFDVFRGRLESAAQLDRLRQFRARGLRSGDPFANQLRNRVLELLVLMHRANFYRAHEVIWKVEGSLHCPAIFPESWFSVNGAASAPRRSSRSSLLCFWLRRNDFLHQRLETRIAVQRIEQWIYFDPADVGAVTFLETLFEPAQRFIFIVQAEIKQGAAVSNHFAVPT